MPITRRHRSGGRADGLRWTHSTVRESLAGASAEVRPLRVLVAEDDDDMRRLIASTLRADGLEVLEVRSGTELLDRIGSMLLSGDEHDAIDLLVSDVRMPGKSGLAILGGLRRSDWSLPVVLITAFGDELLHAEAARLGAAAVMDKPFDLQDLRCLVRSLTAP